MARTRLTPPTRRGRSQRTGAVHARAGAVHARAGAVHARAGAVGRAAAAPFARHPGHRIEIHAARLFEDRVPRRSCDTLAALSTRPPWPQALPFGIGTG